MTLDWKAIRPLNGSRATGFEELCAQLARCEIPEGSRFERKGTPDAGVECYAVLADGSEWGWQAKYFDMLGDSQWSQLDESVETALQKHPRLVRYLICAPLDRPDGRVGGRRSAKERWDDHVQKWTDWTSARGMFVDFVWWGSHELLDRLARSQHVGRVRFWFDVRQFDAAWFKARLDEAVRTAGPRYTPEIHVDLPIAAELETFGRTQQFFDRIRAQSRSIRKKLRSFADPDPKALDLALGTATVALVEKVEAIITKLGMVTEQPVGDLPFLTIAKLVIAAETEADDLSSSFLERERVAEASTAEPVRSRHSFRDRRLRLDELSSELGNTRGMLEHAEDIAGRYVMLLRGDAGTGKTHLLCDAARQRLADGRPTVLLMGQRFLGKNAPWTQALEQLDLPGLSAEEFVGALEAAAQAAGSRALLLIDAINEGAGRNIWPNHLEAFLSHTERSNWVGVLLSVRSSYEESVIPEGVRNRAASIRHDGFAGREYDATRTFFTHYAIELPSTPLLSPEFRNPLFLKTLCQGLNAKGESRLPRGFHGITAIYSLYLSAVDKQLASLLDFNPKGGLVRRALEAFAKALIQSSNRWLTVTTAEAIVNDLLPGREFERTIYRGLVAEGILVEEGAGRHDSVHEVTVCIAYERFADHLIARSLLDAHLRAENPASAFASEGALAYLLDKSQYVPPGLMEALCIQVAERVGQELLVLAPEMLNRWGIGDAFRQSLVWRDEGAFNEQTKATLGELLRTSHDLDDTLDVLLTVATLPSHPLNIKFLDERLRKHNLSSRDAWWSTYLHRAWGDHRAVDRLVDWATAITPSMVVEEVTVDLCATTLSWFLTTSNRFLRDRTTKALVSLMTDRLSAVTRLVERFAEVDDLYVVERVYAVAYGIAMRSHDVAEVGKLATGVYARVFSNSSPPAHILLRDYARGVVERAISLGAKLDIDARQIRPPYSSHWPSIPAEDGLKVLLPDSSPTSHASRDVESARDRIGHSVMDDDFAWYVIGTNTSCTNWLSLQLGEPTWQSVDTHIAMLVSGFSEAETSAWAEYKAASGAVNTLALGKVVAALNEIAEETGEVADRQAAQAMRTECAAAALKRATALAGLDMVLTAEHRRQIQPLLAAMESDDGGRQAPRFDLRQIQRYVLWRVFNLGWTTERFGHFDRFLIGINGRAASKAERIGKKYQWIAYHEIMALVADHFQYRVEFNDENGDRAYDGPWQEHLRDIDPSCTLRMARGGTSWDGHAPAWWCTSQYERWDEPRDPMKWSIHGDALPKVEDLLSVCRPSDGTRWCNLDGHFAWKQPTPADQDSADVERREVWYICTGYLIRAKDADAFSKWAQGVNFWGRWMPDTPDFHGMFLGEHGWSPASRYFQQEYFGDEGWKHPRNDCPVKVHTAACRYLRERGGFDCSLDESYTLRLPATELLTGLQLRWNGNAADYVDTSGNLAAFDPTAEATGPSALLVREDLLLKFLECAGLTICWAVLGEKRVLGAGLNPIHYPSLRMSGAYVLGSAGPRGFLNHSSGK